MRNWQRLTGLSLLAVVLGIGLTACGGLGTNDPPNCSPDLFTPNYVAQLDSLLHWSSLPVRVFFVRDEHYTPELQNQALEGFDQWISITESRISYKVVTNPNEARITVRFNPSTRNGQTEVSYATDSRTIQRAEVEIGVETGQAVDIQTLAAHEFGHALGIQGHSDNPNDLMYPTYTIGQAKPISERDFNTLKTAYCWLFNSRCYPPTRAVEPSGPIRRVKIQCGLPPRTER